VLQADIQNLNFSDTKQEKQFFHFTLGVWKSVS
jgi:hypothetical protein